MNEITVGTLLPRFGLAIFLAAVPLRTARAEEPGKPSSSPRDIVGEQPAEGQSVRVDGGYMVEYSETIPGTNVTFAMVPVPGGDFLLGSPTHEVERRDDEGPQVRVKLKPFWIGKCEVTWAEYRAFMAMYDAFKKMQLLATSGKSDESGAAAKDWRLVLAHAWNGKLEDDWGVDAVTTPTPLYDSSVTYSVGEEPSQPAVTMTQFAAKQYTKWLSGVTGRDYRLPSEAEWEYAARAGTTTAYSFGDDAAELGTYAWFEENGDYQTHAVAAKKPNPWGLYDMHGNVAEWTLDEYQKDAYARLAAAGVSDPGHNAASAIRWPSDAKPFPRVIRGGSWLDAPPACRSAARHKSEEDEWKLSDPNIPLSPWWYTEEAAQGVGMRIVRPLAPMSADEKQRVWQADVDDLRQDVRDRLREGRGALGVADESLPSAIKAAESLRKDN
jgi:formylglycine-generating enzyme required for sulfatase activity